MPKQTSKQDWATPWDFFHRCEDIFGEFTLDACAETWSAKCSKFYSKEQNGLTENWREEHVWCNPPYGNILPWVEKASYQARIFKDSSALLLLPASTDTRWFHEWVMPYATLIFIRGRIEFERPDSEEPRKTSGNDRGSLLASFGRRPKYIEGGESRAFSITR